MRLLLSLLILSLILSNCSTDFDVTADPEVQAVVYALVSQNDSVHYIRIQRTYLTESNALTAAAVTDSIYFQDDVTVTITNINSGQSTTLTKIDGSSVGLDKDSGIFAYDPAYLYTYERDYFNGDSIRLKIRKENSGKEWYAKTALVQDFTLLVNDLTRINLAGPNPYNLRWRSARGARSYDLVLRMYYLEWDFSNPSNKVQKYADWRVFNGEISDTKKGKENMEYEMEGSAFYSALKNQIPEDPNKVRKIDSTEGISFIMSAGGSELYNFNRVQEAQSGLLANEFLPSYTNVTNGLGIFSSKYTKVAEHMLFTRSTVDSVACGHLTKNLNFKNSKGELECN